MLPVCEPEPDRRRDGQAREMPTLLPLELAASFLVPHTASLARTCKRLLLNRRDPSNPITSVDEALEELYTKVRYCLQLGVENMPFVSSWSSEVTRGDTGEFDSQWRFGVYNLDNDGKLIWDDRSWVWIHFDLPEPQTDAHASFCRALAATAPVRFQRAPGQ